MNTFLDKNDQKQVAFTKHVQNRLKQVAFTKHVQNRWGLGIGHKILWTMRYNLQCTTQIS